MAKRKNRKNNQIQPSTKNTEIIEKMIRECVETALCTDPADFPRAKRALSMLYKAHGYKTLPTYICVTSPLKFGTEYKKIEDRLRFSQDNLYLWPIEAVANSHIMHTPSIMQGLSPKLSEEVSNAFLSEGLGFFSEIDDETDYATDYWQQFRDSFIERTRAKLGATPRYKIGRTQLLAGNNLLKSCGGWAALKKYCFISDRPEIVSVDERYSLHSETGPALKFRCGTEYYLWHGINIPKNWILQKDKLSPLTALTHRNIEQRRAAQEIIGWDKVLQDLEYKVVDEDPNPQIGTLIQLERSINGERNPKFLKVTCGTGRSFVLPVPRRIQKAREANAWTYSKEDNWKNFEPEVRT